MALFQKETRLFHVPLFCIETLSLRMRNKRTDNKEFSESEQEIRERKKWQIALRRYIIERIPSKSYAPYFGLDIETFREWICSQFMGVLSWENFGTEWKLEHVVPIGYFSMYQVEDLKLGWNFTNINVASVYIERMNIIGCKSYFKQIFRDTGYSIADKMISRIEQIETSQMEALPGMIRTMQQKDYLQKMTSFTEEDFERINKGEPVKDILLEKEILTKFGG